MEEIMNRCLGLMLGLTVMVFLGTAWGKDKAKPPASEAEAASCHGTAVHFVNTPSEAAQQAKKEEKLVFVLHVSGQFEDPGIT
jgi:hypothetical protein